MEALHDRDGAEELLAEAAWARRLARALVRDAASAEDVAQEALVSALSGAPRSSAGARAWLGRIVRNHAAMRRRAELAREGRERRALRRDAPLPPADEVLARVEAQRALVDEVLALAPPYRDAILLRYFEELPAAEIAARQGVPAGTVRARLTRGLLELRGRLERRDVARGANLPAIAALAAGLSDRAGPGALLAEMLTGGALVSTAAKLCTVAAALAVALVAATAILDSPEGEPDESLPIAAAPATRDARGAAAVAELVSDAGLTNAARSPVAADPPELADAELESEPAALPLIPARQGTWVLARFADGRGVPVTNAVLSWREHAASSDSRGEVALELPEDAAPERSLEAFEYSAERFATGRIEASVRRGETSHLGTIALAPGCTLAGLVVDESGDPVVFAGVSTGQLEVREELAGLHRRHGESWFPFGFFEPAPLRLSASTGFSGEFELRGVPAGETRVWASGAGKGSDWSELLRLEPGEDRLDLLLVLPTLGEADYIRGLVLTPFGEPLPDARVGYSFSTPGLGMGSEVRADEHGRFELLAYADVPHELRALDPEERWVESETVLAPPGTHDLVLDLRPAPPDSLLRDAEGRLVRRVVRVLDEGGEGVAPYVLALITAPDREQRTDVNDGHGRTEIAVPADPFRLEVDAPGFARAATELIDPLDLPEEIVLRLAVIGGARGRVLAAGAPIEGALIELVRRADPARRHACEGLPSWLECGAERRTRSASDGGFALPIPQDGAYSLLVTAPGFALREVGPLDLRAGDALALGDVVLGHGGSLEVRVRAAEGESPAGRIVAVSRGDGRPSVARADSMGLARFDQLAPGRYDVALRESESAPSFWDDFRLQILGGDEPLRVPWVVEVVEDRVAIYALALD